jgi:hypothetical protein
MLEQMMIEKEIPEMDRFLRNFALPEKPHSLLPVVPRNLGDISEVELMSLYSEFMSWVNYAKAQLVTAEIVEERELNAFEYVKACTLIEQWGNKVKGELVTIAKAKRDVEDKVQKQQEAYTQARAYRKLVDTVFDRCERGAQVLSRELSRRISLAPKENRAARFIA